MIRKRPSRILTVWYYGPLRVPGVLAEFIQQRLAEYWQDEFVLTGAASHGPFRRRYEQYGLGARHGLEALLSFGFETVDDADAS